MLQGFLVGSDGGNLFLFERDGEGAARTYRKTKTLAIEGQAVKIRNLAVSPSEDTLLCTLDNNQMYSLNLTNTEVMKVCYASHLCCACCARCARCACIKTRSNSCRAFAVSPRRASSIIMLLICSVPLLLCDSNFTTHAAMTGSQTLQSLHANVHMLLLVMSNTTNRLLPMLSIWAQD